METLQKRPSLAVLMTCFNRREQTLNCLAKLYAQTALQEVELRVFLVDDASTDGSAAAVAAEFPGVEVLRGSGHLYWNRGMRVAFARALQRGFDFYLWLNDDTLLFPKAVETLLGTSKGLLAEGVEAIVTGATCEEESSRVTYGGRRWKSGWKRELELVQPSMKVAVACDTMNGNCTLIPRRVVERVGNLDGRFTHSFGDFDYGFRAVRAGFSVFVAAGFVGSCSDNSSRGTWRDRSSTLRKRWRHLNSVKGSPFPEWTVYCRRHLGRMWPLYVVSLYVKTLLGVGEAGGDVSWSA